MTRMIPTGKITSILSWKPPTRKPMSFSFCFFPQNIFTFAFSDLFNFPFLPASELEKETKSRGKKEKKGAKTKTKAHYTPHQLPHGDSLKDHAVCEGKKNSCTEYTLLFQMVWTSIILRR